MTPDDVLVLFYFFGRPSNYMVLRVKMQELYTRRIKLYCYHNKRNALNDSGESKVLKYFGNMWHNSDTAHVLPKL